MFCGKCGKEIENTSSFCPYCGNKINDQSIIENKNAVTVSWHRRKAVYGLAISIKLYLDGTLITSLKNGETFETKVMPGKHKVGLEYWSGFDEHEIDVPQNVNKLNVEFGIKMGLISNKIAILSITNE